MTERTNSFIRNEYGWDFVSQANWALVRDNVLAARRVLSNADKFPKADFDKLEQIDLEGTCFLLKAPIEYIV